MNEKAKQEEHIVVYPQNYKLHVQAIQQELIKAPSSQQFIRRLHGLHRDFRLSVEQVDGDHRKECTDTIAFNTVDISSFFFSQRTPFSGWALISAAKNYL